MSPLPNNQIKPRHYALQRQGKILFVMIPLIISD